MKTTTSNIPVKMEQTSEDERREARRVALHDYTMKLISAGFVVAASMQNAATDRIWYALVDFVVALAFIGWAIWNRSEIID